MEQNYKIWFSEVIDGSIYFYCALLSLKISSPNFRVLWGTIDAYIAQIGDKEKLNAEFNSAFN